MPTTNGTNAEQPAARVDYPANHAAMAAEVALLKVGELEHLCRGVGSLFGDPLGARLLAGAADVAEQLRNAARNAARAAIDAENDRDTIRTLTAELTQVQRALEELTEHHHAAHDARAAAAAPTGPVMGLHPNVGNATAAATGPAGPALDARIERLSDLRTLAELGVHGGAADAIKDLARYVWVHTHALGNPHPFGG